MKRTMAPNPNLLVQTVALLDVNAHRPITVTMLVRTTVVRAASVKTMTIIKARVSLNNAYEKHMSLPSASDATVSYALKPEGSPASKVPDMRHFTPQVAIIPVACANT